MKILLAILLLILILPNFAFAQKIAELPKTIEEVGEWLENFWQAIKENLPRILKEIWEEEVLPVWQRIWEWFKLNIWLKIENLFKREIEKRKPQIEEEFKKEKEEMKEELPKIKKSLWEKIKEIFK